MKGKIILFTIIGFLIICGVVFAGAYKFYSSYTDNQAAADKIDDMRVHSGAVSEAEQKKYKSEGKNPFGEDVQYKNMTDAMYQEYIHGMSHQKVKADEKWGFYEMTPERIKWLYDGLENADLKHKSVYKRILKKWMDGDFSDIDADHNAIWRLQGGTVGKATGILSPSEEKDFIKNHE